MKSFLTTKSSDMRLMENYVENITTLYLENKGNLKIERSFLGLTKFSEQLDVLIEEQSGEYDKSKRKLQYQEIQNLIWKSYTRFMPVTVSSTWLVNDWLENFYPTLAGF